MPLPAICEERRSYTLDGRIVELRIMVSVTDRQKMVQRFGTDPRDLKETMGLRALLVQAAERFAAALTS